MSARAQTIIGDTKIVGKLLVTEEIEGGRPRSELEQEDLVPYPIPLASFRQWDHRAVNTPETPTADDLGLSTGTFGTNVPKLTTGDVKAAGAITRRAGVVISVPAEYQPGETIKLRISAATESHVADTSSTVDAEIYQSNRDGTKTGSDLCTTNAQSINTTSFTDYDFTIDGSGLEPGDELDIRITIAVTDAASGGTVQPSIGAVDLLCDIKG